MPETTVPSTVPSTTEGSAAPGTTGMPGEPTSEPSENTPDISFPESSAPATTDEPETTLPEASQAVTTDPAVPETTVAATTEPAVTEQAPVQTVPATTEPETAPPTTNPSVTKPTATKPAPTEPETTRPAVTQPTVTKPPVTEPAATKPAATKPEATKPTATQPAATKPTTTKPEPTKPAETSPAVTKPVTTKPAETSPAPTVPPTTVPPATVPPTTVPPATQPPSRGFAVHFIDVGQADASLVICDGKAMLIDGGNAEDSNLIYSYLKARGITHLDYIVASHAHEDHVGGLSGALNYATVGTVFSPVSSYSSKAFQNFANQVAKQGKSLTCPYVGQSFSLGSATCTVLAVNTTSDPNNSSIVLRIVYGSTSFLFTGDAEREVEQAMMNRGANLSSTVLKVGHHGSYTSTSYQFLWNVMPAYAVISCGKNNSYGHPHDEPLSRLRDADVRVFRTDMQGDIICTSNGSSVSFSVSRNWDADVFAEVGGNSTQTTQPPATDAPADTPQGTDYVLNTNSHKFHYPGCSSVAKMSEKNKQYYTGTREELIEQGYDPCGNCDP